MKDKIYVHKMHLLKTGEENRRHSRPYEKRNSKKIILDAIEAENPENHGLLGKIAALYKEGGNEKEVKKRYLKAAKQEELEGNFSRAAHYYSKAGDLKGSRLALQKSDNIYGSPCPWQFAFDNI